MELDNWEAFQKEVTCSICLNFFTDPVTIECGHSLCRPCLWLYWEEVQTPLCCSECRGISKKQEFQSNVTLKNLASLVREARPSLVGSSGERICVTHKQVKRLFCEADKSLLCEFCSESPEHVVHGHSPVEQAAEEYRVQLLKEMDMLWKMTQDMKKHLNQETHKKQSYLIRDYVTLRKVMIKDQYKKMHQFLFEEENVHLQAVSREAEQIFQELWVSEIQMTRQRERLKEMHRELAEMYHKPDMELLQIIGNTFERTELMQMQTPQPVSPKLTFQRFTGILDMVHRFDVTESVGQEMACCEISLSENVISRIFGEEPHSAPEEPRRRQRFSAWRCMKAFTTGRYYWQVDVTDFPYWILSVCKDFRADDNDNPVDFDEAFLLCFRKRNNDCILSTYSPPIIHYLQTPRNWVGVFLNYDDRTVSFYDICKGSLIFTFFHANLPSPLRPILCRGSPRKLSSMRCLW